MMKTLRKVFQRLSGRFDFGKAMDEDKRAESKTKGKRPPKRKRRR